MKQILLVRITDALGLPDGLYEARVNGKDMIIHRDVGQGFTAARRSMPGYLEVAHYDETGEVDFVQYKREEDSCKT